MSGAVALKNILQYDRVWTLNTSAFVITLYLIFLVLVFGGFSAYISRINLGIELAESDSNSGGASIKTVDTLIFLSIENSKLEANNELLLSEIRENEASLSEVVLKRSQANQDYFKIADD